VDASIRPDQRALLDVASTWLSAHCPLDRPPARSADLWAELGGLGWIGLESAGADLVDAVLLAELTGRHLLPAPLLSSWASLPIARHDQELMTGIIEGRRSVVLARVGDAVADLSDVTDVLVVSEQGVRVAAADRCSVEDHPSIDATRSHALLAAAPDGPTLAGVTPQDFDAVRERQLILYAAESLGVGQRCVDLALEHARQREQFGRPIGSYQAVAFALVDAHTGLDHARSLTYAAAWQHVHAQPAAAASAAGAHLAATEAGVTAAETAIQVFGGLGMTWDLPLHHWYKRALVNQASLGPGGGHLDRIATWLFEGSWA
jgi:hypothetical protein